MDSKIEKKKGIRAKQLVIGLVAIGFLYFSGTQFLGDNLSTFKVDKEKVTLSKVIKDKFKDYISINGLVKPISTIYLDAYEAGRVLEILIEEGSMVKKGDIILRLENKSLYGEILRSENSLATKQNNLRETKINFESKRIMGQRDLLESQYRLIKAKRKYKQYQSLFKDELIAKEEYLDAKEGFELSSKSYDVIKFKVSQDSLLNVTGILELQKDLNRMKKTLSMEYERIENLNVRATENGQLGYLDAEIGKRIGQGQNIGQINVLTNYKIESTIDEHYIDRIKRGLTGTFERNGMRYNLTLKKVYPDVRDGKFKIDLVFSDQKPNNIRTGQSYYIKLQLGAPKEAVLITRGAFFQSTGGQWMYVLDKTGEFALKRNIKIGKQNPKYYEVLEGLEVGEDVIISNYDNFGESEKLILK